MPRISKRIARSVSALAAVAVAASMLHGAEVSAHDATCARTDVPGGDWARMGNDLSNSRSQPFEHYITSLSAATLAPAWTFDANRWTLGTNNEITGYPIVSDGCVYVGSSTGFDVPGWVFAINADNGELVWRTQVSGGVFSTLAVADGTVYAFVSKISTPYVIALDQATGAERWRTIVDRQIGSDAVSTPIVFDGMVWVGISGTAAEGDEADRFGFQGSFALLDAQTGDLLKKTYSIPEELWEEGYSGGAIWGTIAIDEKSKYGYAPTGNPFDYDAEHENTNAILKIDLDKERETFGEIVGSYKGDVEEYFPELDDTLPCEEIEELEGVFAAGFECGNLDLDFGATPNIYEVNGRTIVGAGQKSGVYHAFDAETMEPVFKSLLGFPSAVGGIVGSAAFDDRNIYGPHTVGGYIWSINRETGALNWVSPTLDAVHWGNPVTLANRVLYTVDLKGFLNAYDSATGAQLLAYPMSLGSDTRENPTLSWGGVTVARNTVYASIGVGATSAQLPSMPNGFVVAFRPRGAL